MATPDGHMPVQKLSKPAAATAVAYGAASMLHGEPAVWAAGEAHRVQAMHAGLSGVETITGAAANAAAEATDARMHSAIASYGSYGHPAGHL